MLTEGGRLVQRLRDTGAEVQFFPAAAKMPFRLLWNAHRIANVIRRDGVDLVHARSRAPAWSALIAARRTGVPFVTTYHGAYSEKSDVKRLYNSVMARGDASSPTRTTPPTSSACATARRAPSCTSSIAASTAGCSTPSTWRPSASMPCAQGWGIDDSKRVILHAARLTAWKGQKVVIAAAELLSRQRALDDTVFILAGDAQGRSAYRSALAAQIRAAGLDERVRIVGHEDDMAAAFRAAHVAVVASVEPEAFGRAATEAQVMATPVIATDIGAPPETVLGRPGVSVHRATGWLVPPEDPQRLAEALAEALAMTPDEHARMGARARTHVLDAFSLKQMKQQTLQVYDALLGTRLAEPT